MSAPRTLAARRHDEILKRLASDGTITVEDLAGRLSVSRETIRRDLKLLASRGRLDIVHGGAVRRSEEPAFRERQDDNPEGKAAIGRAAARLVEDGMVVLLDSGTTALAVAAALAGKDPAYRPSPGWTGLTVCTSSLTVGLLLCRTPGIRVHLLGGEVNEIAEAAFGIEAIEALKTFRADIAFIGAGGIASDGSITDFLPLQTALRVRMLAAAERPYIIADHTKFGRLTPLRLQPIPKGTGLIVDVEPPPPLAGALRRCKLDIIVA